MSETVRSQAPERDLPDQSWEHFTLYNDVRESLASLPSYFRTETYISGVMATDLHTLNTVLGATIEEQVVRTLNLLRTSWDPDGRYALYSFVRQPQTFPDVRLRKATGDDTLIGIELKGWYLLAKEGEPSLRFQATAAACHVADLIVVVPWVLGNVISGSPILYEPYIESAKYAAQYRNYHWQNIRRTQQDSTIVIPGGIEPYPIKSDRILDKPKLDSGGNFGRLARTGLMESYMKKLDELLLSGIKISHWRQFLKAFQEGSSDDKIRSELKRLKNKVRETKIHVSPRAQSALAIIIELEKLLEITDTDTDAL